MWQDLIMSAVFVIFIPTFIPQILECKRGGRINKFSTMVTIFGLAIVSFCLFSLGAVFSAFLEAAVAFEWFLCLYYMKVLE